MWFLLSRRMAEVRDVSGRRLREGELRGSTFTVQTCKFSSRTRPALLISAAFQTKGKYRFRNILSTLILSDYGSSSWLRRPAPRLWPDVANPDAGGLVLQTANISCRPPSHDARAFDGRRQIHLPCSVSLNGSVLSPGRHRGGRVALWPRL